MSAWKNMEAEGQNSTQMRQEVHFFRSIWTTPFLSLCSAIEGQTAMQPPHWSQTLMSGKPVTFLTAMRDIPGLSCLAHALEHADIHAPHMTHLSSKGFRNFTTNTPFLVIYLSIIPRLIL
jgi:hypothetical protein